VLIHLLGWLIGVPVAAGVVSLVAARPRNGVAYLLFERLRFAEVKAEVTIPVAA
jgi:hypothetical protein